jgi:hypothetical protein
MEIKYRLKHVKKSTKKEKIKDEDMKISTIKWIR